MKNLLKTTLVTITLIGITNLASAAQPVEPKVVGLMFWADTCASCKVLDPKIHAVKGEFVEQPILFATFDHSNDATKLQAAMLATGLGVGDIYKGAGKGQRIPDPKTPKLYRVLYGNPDISPARINLLAMTLIGPLMSSSTPLTRNMAV